MSKRVINKLFIDELKNKPKPPVEQKKTITNASVQTVPAKMPYNDEDGINKQSKLHQPPPQSSPQKPLPVIDLDASLICNIPEHHRLEDILHQKGIEIDSLKSYVNQLREKNEDVMTQDDFAHLEKRAEIQALDLAINNRRQQLINLEMAKNRKINETNRNDETLIQVIIQILSF